MKGIRKKFEATKSDKLRLQLARRPVQKQKEEILRLGGGQPLFSYLQLWVPAVDWGGRRGGKEETGEPKSSSSSFALWCLLPHLFLLLRRLQSERAGITKQTEEKRRGARVVQPPPVVSGSQLVVGIYNKCNFFFVFVCVFKRNWMQDDEHFWFPRSRFPPNPTDRVPTGRQKLSA